MKLKNINMPKPTPEQLALMPQNAIGDIGTRYDIAANPGDGITLSYCVTYFPYIQLIYSDLTGENKALFFIWDEDLATANSIFGTSFTTAGWFLVATDFSTIEAYTGTLDIDTSIFNQMYSRTYFDLLFIYNIACASTSGVNLLTAQKYCEGNIKVLPVLQEKTATENGEYTVDNGYAGLSKVTVNVASGAELNIAYGDTAPQDTTKLWVEGTEPSKVIASNKINGSESISALNTHLPVATYAHCCAVVGDYIYMFGGSTPDSYSGVNTIYKYNVKTEIVEKLTTTLPAKRLYMSCATVGTNIYLFGGQKDQANAVNTIYKFDTLTETITTLTATLPLSNAGMACTKVGTNIYLFGGGSTGNWSGNAKKTIYKFDALTETVVTLATTLPNVTFFPFSYLVGDYIYIFGGHNSTAIYKFNVLTEVIETLSTVMPVEGNKSSYMDCASIDGTNIYLFGGQSNIYKFNANTETIEEIATKIPIILLYMHNCVVTIGSNIYIVGGYNSASSSASNTIYKFVATSELAENNLLINTTLNKNLFKLVNAPTAEVEIGVNGVYRGNANNIAVKETAYVFDTNNYAWVTVDGGVIVDKLASAVTITSEASEYAYNVYDGTDTSGVLRATLGGTNGTLSVKIPCYSGYLFIKGVTADTIATTLTSDGTLNIEETANAGEYLISCKGNSNEFVDGSLDITYGKPAVGYNLSYTNTGNLYSYTTLNVTYADGSTASISANEVSATIENVTYVQVVKIDGSEYNAFNISASGYTESQLLSGIELTGDLAITIYCNICFVEGTQITLADGSTKAIEDITYDDELLTWNFDEGKFEARKPCWIARAGNASYYWNTELSDGTNLQLVGSKGHRLLNIEQGKFIYAVDSLNEHTFKQDGSTPTVISCEKVVKNVKYYNLATEYNINVFANGVLTSQRLNNMYPIKDMKFEKYAKPVVKREDYAEIPDRYYYGLRVAEQSESQNTENAVIFHNSIKEHIIHNMVERDIGE